MFRLSNQRYNSNNNLAAKSGQGSVFIKKNERQVKNAEIGNTKRMSQIWHYQIIGFDISDRMLCWIYFLAWSEATCYRISIFIVDKLLCLLNLQKMPPSLSCKLFRQEEQNYFSKCKV